MRWTQIVPVLIFALLLVGQGEVVAQGTSSSGMFGNRTTGNGTTASTGSAFGSNSAMGSLMQSAASGAPSMNNTNGVGGQARTSNSFVGANTGQAASQNFVGAAQANTSGQSGMGSYGMGGMGGGMGGMGMGSYGGQRMGQGNFGAGMFGGNTTTPAPTLRTTLVLGDFERPPQPEPSQVSSTIAERLVALPALHWRAPAQVEIQGRTAILRGVVATEHDRDLAARVVRLEATVDQVENLIVVGAPAKQK